jgi:hypothetical protein
MQKKDEKTLIGKPAVEETIYEDAVSLVRATLTGLVKKRILDEDDVDLLAKLVRIYGALKEDLRADIKESIKGGSST